MVSIITRDWLYESILEALESYTEYGEIPEDIFLDIAFFIHFDEWDEFFTIKLIERTGDERFPEDTVWEEDYEDGDEMDAREIANEIANVLKLPTSEKLEDIIKNEEVVFNTSEAYKRSEAFKQALQYIKGVDINLYAKLLRQEMADMEAA